MQQTRSPYQIAMIQMDCDLFHVSNNLDKAEKQIREAAAHGAKLICLPEVFNVGYLGTCIPDMMKLAETFPDTDASSGKGTFSLYSGSDPFFHPIWSRKLCFFDR